MRRGLTERRDEIVGLLTQRRHKRGLSQVQLANIMGVHVNAISKWERGLSAPNLPYLIQWCDALGVKSISIPEAE